jgi:hypothetical protein
MSWRRCHPARGRLPGYRLARWWSAPCGARFAPPGRDVRPALRGAADVMTQRRRLTFSPRPQPRPGRRSRTASPCARWRPATAGRFASRCARSWHLPARTHRRRRGERRGRARARVRDGDRGGAGGNPPYPRAFRALAEFVALTWAVCRRLVGPEGRPLNVGWAPGSTRRSPCGPSWPTCASYGFDPRAESLAGTTCRCAFPARRSRAGRWRSWATPGWSTLSGEDAHGVMSGRLAARAAPACWPARRRPLGLPAGGERRLQPELTVTQLRAVPSRRRRTRRCGAARSSGASSATCSAAS